MSAEHDEPLTHAEKFDALMKDFNTLLDTAKLINARLKVLQKDLAKAIKTGGKRPRRVAEVDPNVPKKPSALQRPVVISNELCKFLSFPENTEHSRQEVTTHINSYIKSNNLQDENNRRFIVLEGSPEADKLKTLLRSPDQPVTFFNIQRYLKPHYPVSEKDKKAAAAAAAAVAAEEVVLSENKTSVVKDSQVVEDFNQPVLGKCTEGTSCSIQKAPVKKRVVRKPS